MNISVVLPSLNPDEKLELVVKGLNNAGFNDIIIINDGSDENHLLPFQRLANNPTCTILVHEINRGKGRALKTGFDFVMRNRNNGGVVTVDGDNQHGSLDVKACSERMLSSEKIVLGARDFNGINVPKRSRLGNKITASVFKFACGIKISDTQTGLRAIPFKYINEVYKAHGERFEYETNMLLHMKKYNIPYEEVGIQTVYIEENKTSHFNPIKDSIRIYKVILTFIFSSFSCSLIDLGLFTLINMLIFDTAVDERLRLLIATLGARIVSSALNFIINREAVFKAKSNVKKHLIKYYILCALQMLASFGLVFVTTSLLNAGSVWQTVIKAIIDTVLFFISFQIQREWVFK